VDTRHHAFYTSTLQLYFTITALTLAVVAQGEVSMFMTFNRRTAVNNIVGRRRVHAVTFCRIPPD